MRDRYGTRRDFLESIAFTLAAGLSLGKQSHAQVPVAPKPFIDVHHHFLPPAWVSAYNVSRPGAFDNSALNNWTPSRSVEEMDRQSIQTAIVSLSTPNVWGGDPAIAPRLARITNEYAAKMVADHPDRFGFFASVPITDSAAAIAELNHALDQLHADGIALLTSQEGRYLGHPMFDGVLSALNERGAVVHVHPGAPACCQNVLPGIPPAVVEYAFETTRAILNLLMSGAFGRYSKLRFIFSHGGGAMPFLAARVSGTGPVVEAERQNRLQGRAESLLKTLFFDTMTMENAASMSALLQNVTARHLMFGSDYPHAAYRSSASGAITGLASSGVLNSADLAAIQNRTAAGLWPRLSR
ncbi:MAG: amidohydrolase family protein [Vicinamibacterales bacterium]